MAILNDPPVNVDVLQADLWKYLSDDNEVEVVADWPEDIKHFCDILLTGPGTMLMLGPRITFTLDRTLNCSKATQRHNALSDARALRDDYLKKNKD